MENTKSELVSQLQQMAHQGHTPARMLREMIPLLGPGIPHKLTLIAHMRKAFCLSLAEAKPIAGWSADAMAELSDDQINNLIKPAIAKNKVRWDQQIKCAS